MYALQSNNAEGIGGVRSASAIRPTYSAKSNLGAAYFCQRKYDEAARTYEGAAELTPNANVIFGNLGEVYSQITGRREDSRVNYAQALKLTEQALNVNAQDGQALSYAALYAARLDEKVKAERYRRSAIKLSAHDPRTRLRSALVLAQLQKDGGALAELDHAVKDGVSAPEITNDPAWQRFAAHRQLVRIITKAQKQ